MKNKSTRPRAFAQRKQLKPHLSWTVAKEGQTLLQFLQTTALSDRSRTTIKQLLHDRFISVAGVATTQFDTPLEVGSLVCLHPAPLPTTLRHDKIEIVWQDEDLTLIYKQAGLPTVSSGEEKDDTALRLLSSHLKKFDPRAKVYHLNRIDKDSEGFVLFTHSSALQEEMTSHWERYIHRQQFAVAVEGAMPSTEGVLQAPSPENKQPDKYNLRSNALKHSSKVPHGTGEAQYRVLSESTTGSLLSITLLKGRNNKLRRQLSALHKPIIGDWRSGSKIKGLGKIALQGTAIAFVHPISGQELSFTRPISREMRRYIKISTEELQKAASKTSSKRKK